VFASFSRIMLDGKNLYSCNIKGKGNIVIYGFSITANGKSEMTVCAFNLTQA
jgi:hypothetical protein